MAVRAETDPIEARVQELDPVLLTSVVRRMLDSEDAEIAEWRYQLLTAGSTRGKVFRLYGTAQATSGVVPWSLILKFVPSPAIQLRNAVGRQSDDLSHHDYWLRELRVYESGFFNDLPDGLAVPHCFHTEMQDNGYWLWLEYIDDPFDHKWPVEQFGVAARHFGRFNGKFLAEREIPRYPWLVPHQQRSRAMEESRRKSNVWARLVSLKEQHDFMRRAWPGNLLEEFTCLWSQSEWLYQALESLPKTLKHGDAGNRNVLARRRQDGTTETVAIDWPFLGIGSVGEEIAPLVSSTVLWFGLPSDLLPELDQTVFDGYVQGLRDAGWQGNPKLARLGFTAYNVVIFGLVLSGMPEMIAVDEARRQQIEEMMYGHSIDEIADNCAALRRYILACADEARTLIDSL